MKKCTKCGGDNYHENNPLCQKCTRDYYEERERKYPFLVIYGNDREEFATEQEANNFLNELHSAYVTNR